MNKILPNAGVAERIFASLIDTLIMLAPHLLVAKYMGDTGPAMMLGFLMNLSYFTWFTSSAWQASPGQRILNIHVVRIDGRKLNKLDALERFLVFIAPTLPMYASAVPQDMAPAITVGLSLVWFLPIVINEKRMGVHDQICHMRVVVGKGDAR